MEVEFDPSPLDEYRAKLMEMTDTELISALNVISSKFELSPFDQATIREVVKRLRISETDKTLPEFIAFMED